MFYKLSQLIVKPSKNASTTSEVYIAQPNHEQESLGGKLFVMIEIESDKGWDIKVIDFLINNIHKNYYESDKLLLRQRIQTLKTEHIFETALTKTNNDFENFIKNEKIQITNNLINITAGIINEDKIHFVNTGKNKVFLIYKTNSEEEYKIIDIVKQSQSNEPIFDDKKLFSNVISGEIPKKGNFLITNEALPEYISEKQLTQIITTLPPAGAVEQIKNTLTKINSYISFLAVLIKNTTIEKPSVESTSKPSTHESIINLNKTEETTENILTPSGIINTKKIQAKIPQILIKKQENQSTLTLKDKILTKRKTNIIKKITVIFKLFFGIFANLYKKIVNNKSQGDTNKEKKINRKGKILLLVACFFIILFVINTIRTGNQNQQDTQKQSEEDLAALIEQKQNKAESSLLYSNEEKAGELFNEIEELMKQLPQETEEQKVKYNELNTKLNLQLEKIRRITKIENPQEIANLKQINGSANPKNIILAENKIYAGDTEQNSIYTVDLTDNTITTINTKADTKLQFPVILSDKSILYFNNQNILKIITPEDAIDNLDITLLVDSNNIKAADVYNNRLYLLSTENQIYRYNPSNQGFGSAYSWIQETINTTDAINMSIDGYIYILKQNGEVIRLLKGFTEEFKIETIEPELTSPTKIFASIDNDFLYIMEPLNNRLIIFDKEGEFIAQYQSDKFDNLSDFIIDEENKLMYFLNGSSIYSAQAVHMQNAE